MMKKRICRATLLTALFLGGCSSVEHVVQKQSAASAEATLAAAGFHIEPADTADRLAELHAMPPFEVVAQRMGEKEVYAYADPVKCRCKYVGNAQQYAEYKRLRQEQSTEAAQQEDPRFDEDPTADADLGLRDSWSDPWE